ncbi:MAG TPA: tetratricopeptide repeat protein [Terriglobia bacterium]|nr:tetratricopeptide repeat protein [Terriglobia bacterium]
MFCATLRITPENPAIFWLLLIGGPALQLSSRIETGAASPAPTASRAGAEGWQHPGCNPALSSRLADSTNLGDGWRNVGLLLAYRKDYNRAISAYENLLQINPKDGPGWALLGLCEYELGRMDQAYYHLQYGRSLGIRIADLRNVATYHAALIQIQRGQFEVAHHLLITLVEAGVKDPDLVTALGLAALRINEKSENLREGQKQMVEAVGSVEAEATHSSVSDTMLRYQNLIAQTPKMAVLYNAYSNFLMTTAHYRQAIEQMKLALTLNPQDVNAMMQIATASIKLNQPSHGFPYAERAARLAPKLFTAHYVLGWTLLRLDQTGQAIAELEEAVRLSPNSPQAHYLLSEAYERGHRRAEAIRERVIFAHMMQAKERTQDTPTPHSMR